MKRTAILLIATFFIVNAIADNEIIGNNVHGLKQINGKVVLHNTASPSTAGELDDIFHSAEEIEAGKQPTGIQSNTTSLSTVNIRGSVYTIKSTIFSTGNDQEGAVHNVETVYKGSAKKSWGVDTISWNANEIKRKYSRQGNGDSGSVISSDGSISLD